MQRPDRAGSISSSLKQQATLTSTKSIPFAIARLSTRFISTPTPTSPPTSRNCLTSCGASTWRSLHAPGYMKGPDQGQSEAFCDFKYRRYRLSRLAQCEGCARQLEALIPAVGEVAAVPATQARSAFVSTRGVGKRSVVVCSPSQNTITVLYSPVKLVGTAKILHGHADDYEETARTLNAIPGPRAIVLSYEPTPGVLLISGHPNPDR